MSPNNVAQWFAVSNFVLLVGAALVLLGTFGSIQFGAIKERLADQRIAESVATAAKANERAAELEKEAADVRASLEKTRGEAAAALALSLR